MFFPGETGSIDLSHSGARLTVSSMYRLARVHKRNNISATGVPVPTVSPPQMHSPPKASLCSDRKAHSAPGQEGGESPGVRDRLVRRHRHGHRHRHKHRRSMSRTPEPQEAGRPLPGRLPLTATHHARAHIAPRARQPEP